MKRRGRRRDEGERRTGERKVKRRGGEGTRERGEREKER